MFQTFILSTLKIAAAFPALIAVIYGMMEVANASGFREKQPKLYASLLDYANFLLAVLIEHWLGWLICSAFLGTLWTFVVAEPRTTSKKEFDRRRK